MRYFKRIFFGLLLLIIVLVAGIYIFLLTQKPVYNGTLALHGLNNNVDVYFDDYGVPHIYGNTEEDVFRAMGYVHAQERLFQMELIRRVGSGRLSELFGSATMDVDKFFRMLGLAQHADWSAKEFSKQQDKQFYKDAVAYLAGINQYIENGKRPVEFRLLGIPSEKFTVTDMFLIVDFMSFNFQMAFRTDPLMTKIQRKLGSKYLSELSLGYVKGTSIVPADSIDWSPPDTTPRTCFNDVVEKLPVQPWTGSNSWAVAPSKSKSGKVLFENDTHIGYQQPCVWYEAYLECPDLHLYGNFLAGFPFPAIGHSTRHAWGLTILENDDLDFFEEQADSLHHDEYYFKGELKKMTTREEIIHVKDSGDLKLTVRYTDHGPICSDVIHDFTDITTKPVSACWTLLQFPSNLCEITYELAKSKNMYEFRDGIAKLSTPGLNVIYGDAEGNIAWWTAAKLVKRPAHVEPRLLLNGSTGEDDWIGFYDFNENPHAVNPGSGYVYSCNNQPDTSASGISTPGYFVPEDRARVLTNFFSVDKKYSLDDMQALNSNVTSIVASELSKYLIAHISEKNKSVNDLAKKAVEILSQWNGSMQTDDVGPTIFYGLQHEILKHMMEDELGAKDFFQFQQTHIEKNSIVPLLENDSSVWYDDITTKDKTETQSDIFNMAFDSMLIALHEQLGPDIQKWHWGRVHILEHVHPIGRQKPFNKFFNIGPFPIQGGNETMNNAGFDFSPDGIYRVKFGPALRRTLDFADPTHGKSVLPTGQSGNPMSKHYDDQTELFNACKTRTEMMDKAEIIKSSKDHLLFTGK